MEEKRKRTILWIIVIAGIVIILGVIWYFVSRNEQVSEDAATATPAANTSGSSAENGVSKTSPVSALPSATQIGARTAISTSKTATATQTATVTSGITNDEISKDPILSKIPRNAIVAITPYPGSGPYDWTQGPKYLIDGSKIPKSALQEKTPCEVVGLSDNWDNAIEKFTCDTIDFFGMKVIDMVSQLNCTLYLSALQVNIDSTITGKFENGTCKIEQR